ncbi:hypothetical protein ACVBEH_29055, partial [Roseateles sp. GG27B]
MRYGLEFYSQLVPARRLRSALKPLQQAHFGHPAGSRRRVGQGRSAEGDHQAPKADQPDQPFGQGFLHCGAHHVLLLKSR